MLFRIYLLITVIFGQALFGKDRPLGHDEIIRFRDSESAPSINPTLRVDDWLGFKRLTNVEIRRGFYDNEFFQVANCHPYNPTDVADVAGKKSQAIAMEQPIVIEYNYFAYQDKVQEAIKAVLGASVPNLYLNVQDNPWQGNQLLLRPHAMQWMFPSDNHNYTDVRVYAADDAGVIIVDQTNSVHIHDKVASPSGVMLLSQIDHTIAQAFYSVVVYNGLAAITRHIFLTPEQLEELQAVFNPEARIYSADEFAALLTPGWQAFLTVPYLRKRKATSRGG